MISYYNCNKEARNRIGNCFGPYMNSFLLQALSEAGSASALPCACIIRMWGVLALAVDGGTDALYVYIYIYTHIYGVCVYYIYIYIDR